MKTNEYQFIHIDTTPMTLNGIMTLCKHRLAPIGALVAIEDYPGATVAWPLFENTPVLNNNFEH